uniref:Secreted protein n=1 Tax=Pararge aegeria TaxID=116150 RepID=S4PZU4_9NEOP
MMLWINFSSNILCIASDLAFRLGVVGSDPEHAPLYLQSHAHFRKRNVTCLTVKENIVRKHSSSPQFAQSPPTPT